MSELEQYAGYDAIDTIITLEMVTAIAICVGAHNLMPIHYKVLGIEDLQNSPQL